MRLILTVEVSGRDTLTQEALDSIIEYSTLRECLEIALCADVEIRGSVCSD